MFFPGSGGAALPPEAPIYGFANFLVEQFRSDGHRFGTGN